MKMHAVKRMIALLLAAVLVSGFAVPVQAAGNPAVTLRQVDNDEVSASLLHRPAQDQDVQTYAEHDNVRVSIILEEKSTLEAGFQSESLAANAAAMSYRSALLQDQASLTGRIENAIGETLDVVWNLTLAANIISANVEYGQIDQIAAVPGVEKVVIERTYKPLESVSSAEAKPNMVISSGMTGANQVWETGYHGAGTRIAVIDTGLDTDHQSFDPAALKHAYEVNAEKAGKSYDDYVASLDLLDKEEIAEKLPQLNIHKLMPELTADDLYVNLKAPFGINYIDKNKTITHDNDSASEHGSHVSGISSGNRFLQKDGEFVSAAETVYTLGNAPDSQIIVMKVFGENSPTDADYMAALEDAILLDCDVANLSLGGSNPGGTISLDYQDIMDSLVNTDTVVAIAAGNEGQWSAHSSGIVPNLYVEDVSMHTSSEPSTYTNSLSVASVDNNGAITTSLLFNGRHLGYVDGKGDWHDPLAKLDTKGTGTEYEFVMLDSEGREADYEGIDVTGKIAMVSRGDINFTDKAKAAVSKGAIATLVYNNVVDNTIMVMDGYWESAPCAMISKEAGQIIRSGAAAQKTEAGVPYYTGKICVDSRLSPIPNGHDYHTMSLFSSWGVPGDLSMKPEIAAPGGNIYSVNGAVPETDQYEMMSGTSMATPQVAGISALVMERIRRDQLSQPGLTDRALAQSLMMATADPMRDHTGHYISILQQGAGLANVRDAVAAQAFVTVDGQDDGKVKVELGDDPQRTGSYSFRFRIHNMTGFTQHYELSADLFTQDTFEDYANKAAQEAQDASKMAVYMATTTRDLSSNAVWTVNGKTLPQSAGSLEGCDFDGNGVVTEKDAQALLDYVTGAAASIAHPDRADLSGDGKISAYDAHRFLAILNSGSVAVPSNGTVTVDVTLSLTEEAKAYVEETYPNGAYLQGYVYASGRPTYEGAEGTQLNIPVLGFYGSWTDPSMFELGSTQEKLSGQEIRTTYTGEGEAAEDGSAPASYNTLEVEYYRDPGYSYVLGGNPVDPDEIPNPIRTAINNRNGDRIHSYKFSPIRNAASSRIQLTDSQGNVLWQRFPGPYAGAYYGIMMFFPMWINSNYRYPVNFVPSELNEGESFTASVTLAPEYNTDMVEERADWDSLGHGATLSTTVTIDNTAPEILDVVLGEGEKPSITVTASDNQYIAGVALFDRSGRTVLSSCGSVADAQPGDTDQFILNTNKANGKKFLVQVFDYAYNISTYELNIELGEPVPLPQLIAHDLEYAEYDPGYWTGFTVNATYRDLSTYAKSPVTMRSATMADPYIYAISEDNALYVLHKEDLLAPVRAGVLSQQVQELAYSASDGKIYAVYPAGESTMLATMDPMTGALTNVGTLGIRTNTLAVNADGTFYCNELGTSKVYTFTLDTLSAPVQIAECLGNEDKPFPSKDLQSMEFDPNTGNVVWISFTSEPSSWGGTNDSAYLYEIMPDNTVLRHEDLLHHLVALVIPEKGVNKPDFEPVDTVSGLNLTEETVFLMKSQEHQLTADVLPWNASDRFVFWESDHPEIAAVDGKGLVSALGVGTATITATSRLDPAFRDSVTIHISDVKVTVNGTVQDVSGKPTTFTWNLEEANDWEVGFDLDTDVMAATAKDPYTLYVTSGTGRTMKKIDLFSGSETLSKWVRPMNDLAYSKVFSSDKDLVHMVYSTLWMPAKDLSAEPDGSAWDLMSVLEQSGSGATEFIGIASGGAMKYTEQDGTVYDAELLYLLDNTGGVLQLYCYQVDPASPDYDAEYPYNAGADYYTSDLCAEGYAVSYDDNDNPLSSLVVGNDGNLYFAGFNGASSELYQLVFDKETMAFDATMFADMGEGSWPVALTEVTANAEESAAAAVTGACLSVSALARRSRLQPEAAPAPTAAETPWLDTVTVTLTARDAEAYSGLLSVAYDASAMTLTGAESFAYLDSLVQEEGRLTFGYANVTPIAADAPLLTLTFAPKTEGFTKLTVHTLERNELFPDETRVMNLELNRNCPSQGYTDIDRDAWYHEAVDYVIANGLMKGVTDTLFAPREDMTRAQLVTILYRLAGSPAVENAAPFRDVPADSYYSDAVAWAFGSGITTGVTADRFVPKAPVSRQQLVVFLARYAALTGLDLSAKGDLSGFADAGSVSGYAYDAMVWAVEAGLVEGSASGYLNPQDPAQRAQIAAILMRYCSIVK